MRVEAWRSWGVRCVRGTHEGAHAVVVFAAVGLRTTRHIYRPWVHGADGLGDVLGREATSEEHRHPLRDEARDFPVKRLAAAAPVGAMRRVKHEREREAWLDRRHRVGW